jgi:PKHD-type hydroxylase
MSNKWELQTHQVNAYCYYENIFDDDMVQGIIDAGEKIGTDKAYVGGDFNAPGRVAEEIRKTDIAWLNATQENAWLFRKLTDVILQANQQWFGFELNTIEALQYSVYNVGDFYDGHVDHHFQGAGQFPRKLSFSMQLTDPSEYEGGSTRLITSHEPFAIPKTKGSITFFPSYTLHDVQPITKGTRKALVGWVLGPRWK